MMEFGQVQFFMVLYVEDLMRKLHVQLHKFWAEKMIKHFADILQFIFPSVVLRVPKG